MKHLKFFTFSLRSVTQIIFLVSVVFAQNSFAQRSARGNAASSGGVVASQAYGGQKQVGINAGINSSAFNLGATYDSGRSTGSVGGYFFLQTEKSDSVAQYIAGGVHWLVNLTESNGWSVDMRPGAGLVMIKGGKGTSDTTAVGPSYRLGVSYRLSGGGHIGVERLEVWNWFSDDAALSAASSSVVYRFNF